MNKEKFTAELVCLLEVTAVPPNVAEFKQLMESFFIAGAARIDLIAEIMNLDNDIGGYNFDIPLLQQTEKAIKDATAAKGDIEAFWVIWLFLYLLSLNSAEARFRFTLFDQSVTMWSLNSQEPFILTLCQL